MSEREQSPETSGEQATPDVPDLVPRELSPDAVEQVRGGQTALMTSCASGKHIGKATLTA